MADHATAVAAIEVAAVVATAAVVVAVLVPVVAHESAMYHAARFAPSAWTRCRISTTRTLIV
jgi:hypothetical protein